METEMTQKKKRGRPPRKTNAAQEPIVFSFRPDIDTWKLFSMLTMLNEETPTDVLRKAVQEYVERHKGRLRAMLNEFPQINDESFSSLNNTPC